MPFHYKDTQAFMISTAVTLTHDKETIAFQGDLMGHLQYILPKMQWLLYLVMFRCARTSSIRSVC